jgi:hypothetical protein
LIPERLLLEPVQMSGPQWFAPVQRRRDIDRHTRSRSRRWLDLQPYWRAIPLGTPWRSFVLRSIPEHLLLEPTVPPGPQWVEPVPRRLGIGRHMPAQLRR